MRKPQIIRALAATIALLAAPLPATAVILDPTHYTSFASSPGHTADSPFSVGTPTTFYLETFEDGALNTPGVSVTTSPGVSWGVGGGANFIDSVDGDDSVFNGNGNAGHSMGIGPSGPPAGSSVITFLFNAGVLGQYPTHAGIVFTDIGLSLTTAPLGLPGDRNGHGFFTFEAFDPMGTSLGSKGPVEVGDYFKAGSTGEDLFFGVIDLGGISKIVISMDSHDAELDHLQYGFTRVPDDDGDGEGEVPEPATFLVWAGLGLAAAVGVRTRRRA